MQRSKWTKVTLRMQQKQVAAGTGPVALLYTDNVSDHLLSMGLGAYRIHLEGENGEPPRTEWYHRLLGDPGYAPLMTTLNVSSGVLVAPENTYCWSFLLGAFYEALPPGKYSLYLEVEDPATGSARAWLRTNSEEFTVAQATTTK
ncbi:hypothetical protein ACFPT7_18410 [Acidicapsa dinghuensis]|uniref:DUF4832 domain-containing protein n=2 Tax=Acidicapsa dinghuensis TaxID=2218256 RepID=A0ABW1EJV2_9BACT